jgi:hypothetical protein
MFFIQFNLLLIERSQSGVGVRSGSIQIVTDPDPGSPKKLKDPADPDREHCKKESK